MLPAFSPLLLPAASGCCQFPTHVWSVEMELHNRSRMKVPEYGSHASILLDVFVQWGEKRAYSWKALDFLLPVLSLVLQGTYNAFFI